MRKEKILLDDLQQRTNDWNRERREGCQMNKRKKRKSIWINVHFGHGDEEDKQQTKIEGQLLLSVRSTSGQRLQTVSVQEPQEVPG
jgi:hypothetical protein